MDTIRLSPSMACASEDRHVELSTGGQPKSGAPRQQQQSISRQRSIQRNSELMSLSNALCRPTSSRTAKRWPAESNRPAACKSPVRLELHVSGEDQRIDNCTYAYRQQEVVRREYNSLKLHSVIRRAFVLSGGRRLRGRRLHGLARHASRYRESD
jgi:hypothetical protein